MADQTQQAFNCLKCGQLFYNVRKGEEHQAQCKGVKKGFRQPKKVK